MKICAALLGWLTMLFACILLSRQSIHLALVLAVIAALLRILPPQVRLRRFGSFEPFITIFPLWGVFLTVPREHHSATVTIVIQAIALV